MARVGRHTSSNGARGITRRKRPSDKLPSRKEYQEAVRAGLLLGDAALKLANAHLDKITILRGAVDVMLNCRLCGGSGLTFVNTKTGELGEAAGYSLHSKTTDCPCRYNARKALAA